VDRQHSSENVERRLFRRRGEPRAPIEVVMTRKIRGRRTYRRQLASTVRSASPLLVIQVPDNPTSEAGFCLAVDERNDL